MRPTDHRALVGGSLPRMDRSHCLPACRRTHIVKSRSHLGRCPSQSAFDWEVRTVWQSSGVFDLLHGDGIGIFARHCTWVPRCRNRSIYVGHWIRICPPLRSCTMRQVTIRKVRAMAYLPGIIAGVILWAYRKNMGWGMAIAALFTLAFTSTRTTTRSRTTPCLLLGANGHRRDGWDLRADPGSLKTCLAAGSLALIVCGHSLVFCRAYFGGHGDEGIRHRRRSAANDILTATSEGEAVAKWRMSGLDRELHSGIQHGAMVNGGPSCVQTSKEGDSPYYWGEQKFLRRRTVFRCHFMCAFLRFSGDRS